MYHGNKGTGKTTSGCRKGTLPGEDSTSVCLKRWVNFQEAAMREGLFPCKWTVALVKIWKLENTLEEYLGVCIIHDKAK